jgi:hypothetical protein
MLGSTVGVPLPILDQYLLEELFQPLVYGLLAFSSLALSIGEDSDPPLLRLLRRGLFLGHALTLFLPHKQSTYVLIVRRGKITLRVCYWNGR